MHIRLSIPGQPDQITTLEEFADANEIAPDELVEMVGQLTNGFEYVGGGGASPHYTIVKINPPTDWGKQATSPSYDPLRGQEGSPRWIACRGLTDEQIRLRDKARCSVRLGSWLEMVAAERTRERQAAE